VSEPENLEQDLTDPADGNSNPTGRDDFADPSPGASHTEEPGYRLAESERAPAEAPLATPPAAAPKPACATESTFEPASAAESPRAVEDFPNEPPAVDAVWSRTAEWKEPLLWSAAGITFSILIVIGGDWVAAAVFIVALLYGAYYIIISLEVPVRVTPEQSAKEFYGAAGHRMPNYRRMYTLLTADGRQSDDFSDFADFRAYWQAAIARMSRSATWLVPLDFRIEGFRCRYNGDKTLARVRYILKVSPRGRPESDEPAAEFEIHNLAVKGPDGQWYLNDGTLPEPC